MSMKEKMHTGELYLPGDAESSASLFRFTGFCTVQAIFFAEGAASAAFRTAGGLS